MAVRVHELAKEFGVPSKIILSTLSDMGEYVKSASSTVEAPVVRRLKEEHGDALTQQGAKSAPAKKAPAKTAEPEAPVVEDAVETPVVEAAPVVETVEPAAPVVETPVVDSVVESAPPAADPAGDVSVGEAPVASPVPGPRPGNNPYSARPGNNPFSSRQGMQQERAPRPPAARDGAPAGTARGGPGIPRPNPAMMPKQSQLRGPSGPGARAGAPGRPGGPGGPGGRPGGPGARPGGGGGFGGPGARPGGGGGFGGPGARPGGGGPAGRAGRGGTQGAFGRAGGPVRRGRKSKRAKRQEFDQMQAPTIGGVRLRKGNGEAVRLARGASLTDFADKIGVDAASLVQMLFALGEMVTATQSVNDEILELLGEELNYDVQVVSPEDEDRELLESFDLEFGAEIEDESVLVARPPVVTVMGHVDHGKTKLLDALRNSNVVDKEAGGITQSIGAYQVRTDVDGNERRITLIDTPGHEAFTAMRARGAQATDIAILVVAADDGVMPQTVEALNHAKAAGVPIVVAVNKVDKPDSDPTKVRGQLSEYGLVPEEYGGDAMFVDVSAKAGTGLDKLLEAVILTADASLDLRANPEQNAEGLAIEAHLDRGRGPVATVLVQRGTLRVGDTLVAGSAFGRVRALLDEHGESVDEALPSRPVMVLGLTAVPGAGDNFMVVDDDRIARQIAEKREARERNAALAKRSGRRTLEEFMAHVEKGETNELLLILKGDSSGSVEALEDALAGIDVGDEVALRVIDRGVGAITETNVDLAAASDAVIIGYNVRPQGKATELADREGVEIKYYSVIYQAIDEIEASLKGLLKPIYEEQQLGTAEIRDIFRSSKIGNIAGCMVTSGTIRRNAKVRLLRDGAVVTDNADLASLKREKDDASEVREGFECGLVIKGFGDIKIGDVIEAFELVEKPRD